MPTIKAALCREFGQPLVMEEVMLAAPGPGEVMIDIKACAICHSDIHFAEGAWGGELPAIYGHEAAGIVSAVGEGVDGFRSGDHVVVTLIRSCGTCRYCARGGSIVCEEVFELDRKGPFSRHDGTPILQALRTGAFAEKVVVHASQIVAVPPEIPFASAALLGCGVITGFGAVANSAGVRAGEAVAIIGCGGVGLNSIQAARIAGADPIIAIDLSDEKLEAARRFGATHGFNAARQDAPAEVMALTEQRGVDFVFVTVGAKPAFDGAFDYIMRNGTLVVVGLPPTGVMAEYDPGMFVLRGQRIVSSKMGGSDIARDIPALVEHYRAGRLLLDELVTATYPLESINEAIAAVKDGKALRNVIVFE